MFRAVDRELSDLDLRAVLNADYYSQSLTRIKRLFEDRLSVEENIRLRAYLKKKALLNNYRYDNYSIAAKTVDGDYQVFTNDGKENTDRYITIRKEEL